MIRDLGVQVLDSGYPLRYFRNDTKKIMETKPQFAFFGTPKFAVHILEELSAGGFLPTLIITAIDTRQGRGLVLTPSPVKVWAEQHGIPCLQPEKIDSIFIKRLETYDLELGIVAAYGKILPKELLQLFPKGVLNVHPSLLPKYRGSSPIEGALLTGDSETGVSIMLLDEEMDHGPILSQEKFVVPSKMNSPELEEILAHIGGVLLVKILGAWLAHTLREQPQDHSQATYTKKIKKSDGEITAGLSDEEKSRRFRAYYGWPGSYFMHPKAGRVKITDADMENGVFIIKKVIPEGKKEIAYEEFERNYK